MTPQDHILHSYLGQINRRSGAQYPGCSEKSAMKQAGHPVALPTGVCRAVAVILANGTVVRAELAGCASQALGKIELEAIHAAPPLPPTPFGANASVIIETNAPEASPGVNER